MSCFDYDGVPKQCLACGELYYKPAWQTKRNWAYRLVCSRACTFEYYRKKQSKRGLTT